MKYFVNRSIVIVVFSALLFSLAEGIGFGIKAGLNIADMHGDDTYGMQSRIGLAAGGLVSFDLGDVIIIQPEMLYTQKGPKWENGYMGTTHKVTYKLNYLEIPLLYKITIPTKGVVRPNLFIGPYFGINVSARYRVEIDGESWEEDITDFQDSEFGLVFGTGVDYVLAKGKIGFEGRYTLGLTSTSEQGRDLKNNVISFMLGYSF